MRRIGRRFVRSGRLAQLGEHHVRNVGVVGSNPMPSTNEAEHFFLKKLPRLDVYLQV